MHLKNYLHSFKFSQKHFYTLALDFIFFLMVIFSFQWFNQYLQQRTQAWGIPAPDQMQNYLAALPPEKLTPFLMEIKSFFITFLLGLLVLVIVTILLYSLAQALIWNRLTNQKLTKKTYWRWNPLNLFLALFILVYLFIFLILKIILTFLFTLFTSNVLAIQIFSSLINFFFLLIFIVFLLLVYHNFVQKYRIFESIGLSFQEIKTKWSRLWRLFLLAVVTGIIPFLLSWPFSKWLQYQPEKLLIISGLISLLYLTWLRIYAVETVSHEHS